MAYFGAKPVPTIWTLDEDYCKLYNSKDLWYPPARWDRGGADPRSVRLAAPARIGPPNQALDSAKMTVLEGQVDAS